MKKILVFSSRRDDLNELSFEISSSTSSISNWFFQLVQRTQIYPRGFVCIRYIDMWEKERRTNEPEVRSERLFVYLRIESCHRISPIFLVHFSLL